MVNRYRNMPNSNRFIGLFTSRHYSTRRHNNHTNNNNNNSNSNSNNSS